MTSRQLYLTRIADLHTFFKLTFKGRWANHIRKKLGVTALDTLKPYHRAKCKRISLPIMDKLEAYAAELGYAPLSSETGPRQPFEGRCPVCSSSLCVIFTRSPDRGPSAR